MPNAGVSCSWNSPAIGRYFDNAMQRYRLRVKHSLHTTQQHINTQTYALADEQQAITDHEVDASGRSESRTRQFAKVWLPGAGTCTGSLKHEWRCSCRGAHLGASGRTLACELCFGAFPNRRRSHGGTTASLAALLTFNVLRLSPELLLATVSCTTRETSQ